MSAGHLHRFSPGLDEHHLDQLLADPRVAARLAQKPVINRAFDMPFLAGYSRDARIVYIDRHLPARGIKIGSRLVNVVPFLVVHEVTEKSLIDVFGYKYQAAHECATEAENRAVRSADYNPRLEPKPYNDALKPYIKSDELERVKLIPRDLDLTPFIDTEDWAVLNHVRAAMGRAEWQRAIKGTALDAAT